MFLEPSILSIVVAKFRKGKFKNLEDVHIRGWYFLVFAAILQIGLALLKSFNSSFSNIILEKYFYFVHIISYLLLIIGISLNIKKFSMKVFLIGIILNFLVIFSNGGQMPVSIDGIKGIKNPNAGVEISHYDIKHKALDENTRFRYLSDIIFLPPPYPLPKIISIGDIFLMTGVFIFFQETMIKNKDPN